MQTPSRSKRTNKQRMSPYEESMLKLNEKKINLALKHAEELHALQKQKLLQEIKFEKELHAIRLQAEKKF